MKRRHIMGIIPLVCAAPATMAEAQEIRTSETETYQTEEHQEQRAVPETYIVQPGDTLWDISANILQNPWYWPKVWSYNPDITNPHMIYPGDAIRFQQPPASEMPVMADYASRNGELFDDGGENGGQNNAAGTADDGQKVKRRPVFEIISDVATVHRAPGTVQVMVESLVTKDELEESGVIYKAAEERILLTAGDKIYLKFPSGQDVEVGAQYQIFRTIENVKHPESKESYGYLTQITGLAEVTMVHEKVATAIIKKSSSLIERGQFVMPLTDDVYRLVEPKANENEVRGVVLATKFQETKIIGEQELIFIDKGRADGVAVGNTFKAVYRGDPLFGEDEDLPEEEIAALRIVDVKENVSTALVLHAKRELDIGTPVVMKPW